MDTPPDQDVRRRKVFYISGFDPKGPAYYHALYSEEAQKQALINGMSIQVGDARRKDRYATAWTIKSSINDQHVETSYEVLRWDDIMRDRMRRKGPAFVWKTLQTYWLYLRTGALWRILKLSYPAFLSGLYPIVFLAGLVGLAALAALTVFVSIPETISLGQRSWAVPLPLAIGGAGGLFIWLLSMIRHLEDKVPFFWPLHVYAFAVDHMDGRLPQMDQRIELFAKRIMEHISSSSDDEVLIASHSNGTVVAVMAVAAALRADPGLAEHGPAVSFLTLGQSIPLCGLLPAATDLRRDLAQLASENAVTWIDITAPRDAACFALTDPREACGLDSAASLQPKPKLLSVPIGDLFSPETFRKRLHRRWLRTHFQYLMAYEQQTPYDYFEITAGPCKLATRFAKLPSKDGFSKFRLFD